jgi:membrane-associated HD superfamily phosphohydrolase
MVKKGVLIAEQGKVVGQQEYEALSSLRKAYMGENVGNSMLSWLYLGYLLLVSVAIIIILTFLWLLRKDIFLNSRKMGLLFLLIVITCVIYSKVLMTDKVDVLLVPLCILPLVVRAFFDTRSALFVHVLTMLILGSIAPSGFDFVYMQIITGMVAVFSVFNMRKRAQLFLAVGLIFLTYCVTYIGISLLNEGSIDKFNYVNLLWLLGNGFLTLLAYPLIFFIEKIFGLTSDFSLMVSKLYALGIFINNPLHLIKGPNLPFPFVTGNPS